MLDLYGLKMALFDNGRPDKFLLFVRNFQMTLDESVTISDGAKIQYLCIIVSGEVLRQLGTLSVDLGSMTSEDLK